MTEEMYIMRMNIFRWKVVHAIFGTGTKRILPCTIDEFESKTKWTHILSARLLLNVNLFDGVMSINNLKLLECITALMEKSQMRTLRFGMENKEKSGLVR